MPIGALAPQATAWWDAVVPTVRTDQRKVLKQPGTEADMEAMMVRLQGTPAAPGLAAGPLIRLAEARRLARTQESPEAEREALAQAILAAQQDLLALIESVSSDEEEGILAFQLALLDDEELIRPANAAIDIGEAAHSAWHAALELQIADYESSEDLYFRGRAADLRDLRDRVLDSLMGAAANAIPAGAIVVADDLAPSRFLATDWSNGGLVLHRAGTTSHVAILARARGVPMLVGIDGGMLEGHKQALLDAHRGLLILDPDLPTRSEFDREREAHAARVAADARHLGFDAKTTAGVRVRVMINIARPQDLDVVDAAHTDGIGLVRTEFLFHDREHLPDEEEQYRVYRRILEWAAGKPVTIRTLDAGGDKPIPGLTREAESNPFLGIRGVRLSLRRPDVLHVQMRALVRAAVAGNLKIMLPMVTVADELEQCRLMLDRVVAELGSEAVPVRRPELGIMVEVPAAALAIDEFEADFYSIGSNDLLQYLTASSRDEPELAALSQPGTAFWRAIRNVAEHGLRHGRDVSLCGDLASDIRHVPALLGYGVRTLSVAPAALAAVKAAVARS